MFIKFQLPAISTIHCTYTFTQTILLKITFPDSVEHRTDISGEKTKIKKKISQKTARSNWLNQAWEKYKSAFLLSFSFFNKCKIAIWQQFAQPYPPSGVTLANYQMDSIGQTDGVIFFSRRGYMLMITSCPMLNRPAPSSYYQSSIFPHPVLPNLPGQLDFQTGFRSGYAQSLSLSLSSVSPSLYSTIPGICAEEWKKDQDLRFTFEAIIRKECSTKICQVQLYYGRWFNNQFKRAIV